MKTNDTDQPQQVVSAHRVVHEVVNLPHPFPKLKPHHAKPVRKRHVAGLAFFVFLLGAFSFITVWLVYDQLQNQLTANLTIRDQIGQSDSSRNTKNTVHSSLGFSFAYDETAVMLTAMVGPQSFSSGSLETIRAYDSLSFSPRVIAGNSNREALNSSSMNIWALTSQPDAGIKTDGQLKQISQSYANLSAKNYTVIVANESTEELDGVHFVHQVFKATLTYSQRGDLAFGDLQFDIYAGVLPSGIPVIIKITAANAASRSVYQTVLTSFSVSTAVSLSTPAPTISQLPTPKILNVAQRLGIMPMSADAANLKTMDEPRIVATNVPAVVKIYHVTCGVISYRGQVLTTDSCSGDSGTGFFVSSDGYIATNGHVVSSDPKEVITNNMTTSILTHMLQIDGYTKSEITAMVTQVAANSDFQSLVAKAVNNLPETALTYSSQKEFYVVALSSDVPELTQIIDDRTFKETTTLKLATLKAIDYNASDLTSDTGFTHSDVALLHVDGSEYPFVHLGSLNGVVQGMPVTIIGYPSDAETNTLVKSDALQTTATQGIVSAVREVNGGNLKVVQSDVNIGHGNSGGPAFDQFGQVFGIATYMLGGSESGDSSISYLRDIHDLRNLMIAHGVVVDESSRTQSLWEHGLSDFYGAHYGAAIINFKQVQSVYSPHTLASQYIDLAKARIAVGEEARSPWVSIVAVIGLLLSLGGIIVFVVLMVRHRAHHHLYRAIESGYLHTTIASLPHVHSGR